MATELWQPTPEQQAVVSNKLRRLRVLAGPGTGKSTTLIEAVAERIIDRGVAPESIVVLTYSRRAAAELSDRILARVGLTTRAPLVRTLHAYAFSLVRAQAARRGEPPPRLITAAESDQTIRELLLGNAADGATRWPEFLHPALPLRGFATSVRDFLARATERGLRPADLIALGRRQHRPEWVALGQFATQYSTVLDLQAGTTRQGQALDQAELMGVALGLLRSDEVLAREQSRVRRIFVDEYQDVDPAQARLVEVLADGADELIVAGDPDQSIYAFRGSDTAALRSIAVDGTVSLSAGFRLPSKLTEATRRVATLLPGPSDHRRISDAPTTDPGSVEVRVLTTTGGEATHIADQLRRAHLLDGIDWSQMAVLVRSPAVSLPALRRAFAVAGVPLAAPTRALPMSEDPVVAALLLVLACGSRRSSLTAERAAELMTSPLGRLDALALRRLRRALRIARPGEGPSTDLLAAVLSGAGVPVGVPADLVPALEGVRSMLAAAEDHQGDATAEAALWRVWRASGLENPLVAAAGRGGLVGQRADATLDAVMLLFEAAADRAVLVPGAGIDDFLDAVIGRTVDADGVGVRATPPDAVTVLSAHAAKGLQWDVVAVAGVQEGTWPDLGTHGDLLGSQDLLDLAAGVPIGRSRLGAELADERRLFYVAVTRARRRLLVSAVTDSDTQPSRFLTDLIGSADSLAVGPEPLESAVNRGRTRGLNIAELVADLRRAVTDAETPESVRQEAAGHLATLADLQVRGADPRDWWGLDPRSMHAPQVQATEPITLSPSAVESILRCSLRAAFERTGGRGPLTDQQVEGIVVHALAQGIALGVPQVELMDELHDWLERFGTSTAWQLARQRRLVMRMTEAARAWFEGQHPPWTIAGAELTVRAAVPPAELRNPAPDEVEADAGDPAVRSARPPVVLPGAQSIGPSIGPSIEAPIEPSDEPDRVPSEGLSEHAATRPVILAGRVDWLSLDDRGRPVVVDFKTTATVKSKADVEQNPQLASYQIALSERDGGAPTGGARLVYLKKGGDIRSQEPLTAQARAQWIGTIRTAADRLASDRQVAVVNESCDKCPVRGSCPLRPEGQQVTR